MMSGRRRTAAPSLVVATFLFFSTIHVANAQQNRSAQVARAEQLFNDAKKLLEQNDVPKACASFAESQQLDPQLGTLLNLALCHEREGKDASAWTEFTGVVSLATRTGQAKRAEFAKERAHALEPKLSRVRFDTTQLPKTASVSIDGTAVDRNVLDETPVPLDPGPHAIVIVAQGRKRETLTVDVARGPATATFRLPALSNEEVTALPAASPPPTISQPTKEESSSLSTMQWAGIGTAGVGAVAVVVGTVFGLSAASLKDDSGCGETCTTPGARTLGEARDAGAVSTIAFISGGVFIAAGAAMFFLFAPSAQSEKGRSRGSSSNIHWMGSRVVF
jgi:hypothetical protein